MTRIDEYPPEDGLARAQKWQQAAERQMPSESESRINYNGTSETLLESVQVDLPVPPMLLNGDGADSSASVCPVSPD